MVFFPSGGLVGIRNIGRIPVKIKGTCKKGDYIIAQEGGVGKADIYDPHKHDLIGIALTDSNNGLTEVKV